MERSHWLLLASLAACGRRTEATRGEPVAVVAPAAHKHSLAVPSAASASASTAAAPLAPFTCQHDVWLTYGHDHRHSSSSRECVDGPLKLAWRAAATSPVKARPPSFEHAIAGDEGVFAVGLRGKSSMLHALNLDGSPRWDHDTRTDLHFAYWPLLAHGVVMINDDGSFLLDPESGKMRYNLGLDSWGHIAADDERFYWTNSWHVHGPPLYLGAWSSTGEALWKQSKYGGSAPMDMMDDLGGVTVDGPLVFQVANYKFASFSGVSAFEGASGRLRWNKPAQPVGYASAADGRLFLVERWQRERRLVARSQRDGEVLWSTPIKGLLGSAPAVAGDLVLTSTEKGTVVALAAATGELRWRAELDVKHEMKVGNETWLALTANHAAVVAAGKELAVLGLGGGEVRWRGAAVDQTLHSPIVAGGRVYAVGGGELFAFEADSAR